MILRIKYLMLATLDQIYLKKYNQPITTRGKLLTDASGTSRDKGNRISGKLNFYRRHQLITSLFSCHTGHPQRFLSPALNTDYKKEYP
jgi:hypothetical protein